MKEMSKKEILNINIICLEIDKIVKIQEELCLSRNEVSAEVLNNIDHIISNTTAHIVALLKHTSSYNAAQKISEKKWDLHRLHEKGYMQIEKVKKIWACIISNAEIKKYAQSTISVDYKYKEGWTPMIVELLELKLEEMPELVEFLNLKGEEKKLLAFDARDEFGKKFCHWKW